MADTIASPASPLRALKASLVWRGPGRLQENAWVVLRRARIVEVCRQPPAGAVRHDLGDGLLLPGLVNAHTHLELSFLAGLVPPQGDFVAWVDDLVRLRPGHDQGAAKRAAQAAARAMAECGTALVGDITNTGRAQAASHRAGLSSVSFYEALGPSRAEPPPESLHWQNGLLGANGIAVHAPYSVPAWRLRNLRQRARLLPISLHLAESRAEMEFFSGIGAEGEKLEHFLEARGLPKNELGRLAPSPVEHLLNLGLLGPGVLAVHGVQLAGDDLEAFAQSGASLCVCPRSNLGLTGKIAPVEKLDRLGVNLALGTDSLASAPDLKLWSEMTTLARSAPGFPPESILTMATLGGARALGLGGHFGSIDPGKIGQMVFVPLSGAAAGQAIEAVTAGGMGADLAKPAMSLAAV